MSRYKIFTLKNRGRAELINVILRIKIKFFAYEYWIWHRKKIYLKVLKSFYICYWINVTGFMQWNESLKTQYYAITVKCSNLPVWVEKTMISVLRWLDLMVTMQMYKRTRKENKVRHFYGSFGLSPIYWTARNICQDQEMSGRRGGDEWSWYCRRRGGIYPIWAAIICWDWNLCSREM